MKIKQKRLEKVENHCLIHLVDLVATLISLSQPASPASGAPHVVQCKWTSLLFKHYVDAAKPIPGSVWSGSDYILVHWSGAGSEEPSTCNSASDSTEKSKCLSLDHVTKMRCWKTMRVYWCHDIVLDISVLIAPSTLNQVFHLGLLSPLIDS